MKMVSVIDHLVVTAPTLEVGAAFVRDHLGAKPEKGGAHAKMGTYNLLLSLGATTYLEVIAIDPDARPPAQPRWFGLDHLRHDAPASLAGWVARTKDLHAAGARASEDLGSIAAMTRGDLAWLITIPQDGVTPLDGCAPLLIEWQRGAHPASRLPDLGLRLARLELHHRQPERLRNLFGAIDLQSAIDVVPIEADARAHLVAAIDTPQGRRVLASA